MATIINSFICKLILSVRGISLGLGWFFKLQVTHVSNVQINFIKILIRWILI